MVGVTATWGTVFKGQCLGKSRATILVLSVSTRTSCPLQALSSARGRGESGGKCRVSLTPTTRLCPQSRTAVRLPDNLLVRPLATAVRKVMIETVRSPCVATRVNTGEKGSPHSFRDKKFEEPPYSQLSFKDLSKMSPVIFSCLISKFDSRFFHFPK